MKFEPALEPPGPTEIVYEPVEPAPKPTTKQVYFRRKLDGPN